MDQAASEKPIEKANVDASPAVHQKAKTVKALVIIAILAIVCAIVLGALYATSRVPSGAAAKVNDSYISESDVNSYITQYRASHSLTDDTALAQALSSQGLSVAKFRINAIDQLATTQLVNARAEELGVTPNDEDVQKAIDQAKSTLAFNDDSIWQRTLQQYGMTEDQVKEQNRNNLAQQAVLEKDVPKRAATDDEALSYAKAHLAESAQKHYVRIEFSGDDHKKQAEQFAAKLGRYLAASSFGSAKAEASSVKELAKKNGASVSSYAWTIGLASDNGLVQTLGALSVGATSDPQSDSDANTTSIYLCDDSYTFPTSKDINSLKKADVPASLWEAVKEGAGDSVWNSDCTAYLAKLLAQAKITYYPLPDDASYNVDVSVASATSNESSQTSNEG